MIREWDRPWDRFLSLEVHCAPYPARFGPIPALGRDTDLHELATVIRD
jgi:hypothetical protein